MSAPSCPKCGCHDRTEASTIGGQMGDPVPVWLCDRCMTVFKGNQREWDHPVDARQRREVWGPYFDKLDALRAERDPKLDSLLTEALQRVEKYGRNPVRVLVESEDRLVQFPPDGSLEESPF